MHALDESLFIRRLTTAAKNRKRKDTGEEKRGELISQVRLSSEPESCFFAALPPGSKATAKPLQLVVN